MTKEERIKNFFNTEGFEASIEECLEYKREPLNDFKEFIEVLYALRSPSCCIQELKDDIYHCIKMAIVYAYLIKNDPKETIIDRINNLKETLIKKNRAYNSSFDKSVKKFGYVYIAIELDKKKNRFVNLIRNKELKDFESIDDTLLDIAGYLILTLLLDDLDNIEKSYDPFSEIKKVINISNNFLVKEFYKKYGNKFKIISEYDNYSIYSVKNEGKVLSFKIFFGSDDNYIFCPNHILSSFGSNDISVKTCKTLEEIYNIIDERLAL